MGLTYANLTLTNRLTGKAMDIRALVDTGATFMCVPEHVAIQLGFDLTSAETHLVTLGDGSQRRVPKIEPIKVHFGDRAYSTEALVLGDEPLMGVLPLEAMDLVVDPRNQMLQPNPAHPNFPVALAK
jgi:clan AA aspartic protease